MGTIPLPIDQTASGLTGQSAFKINSPKGSVAIMGIADPGGAPTDQTPGWGVVGLLQASAEPLIISPPAGVYGSADIASAPGVYGVAYNSGPGVSGNGEGGGPGVYGTSVDGIGVQGISTSGIGVAGVSTAADGVNGTSSSSVHAGVSATNSGGGPAIWANATTGDKNAGYFIGNVTITETLTVNSNVTITETLTVGNDIILTNADCAEDFAVDPSAEIDPGTVLVLDEAGVLTPNNAAYDRRVAGVVAGAGEFKPGIVLGRKSSGGQTAPIALVGRTYCKADANYGAIGIGDLLTTSPTSGHAMRAGDPAKAFGSVIGKALSPLQDGRGLIPILVALQ